MRAGAIVHCVWFRFWPSRAGTRDCAAYYLRIIAAMYSCDNSTPPAEGGRGLDDDVCEHGVGDDARFFPPLARFAHLLPAMADSIKSQPCAG
jgi:hypothetical protein